jgi:hypothetical protein
MARHVLRNALVLWLAGQHLNRPCKSGEATKATGKQKWPTLRNVGIRYRAEANTTSRKVGSVAFGCSLCRLPSSTADSSATLTCHDSTSAILSTCLAMFCTSAKFTATVFPSHLLVIFFAHLTFRHSLSCPIFRSHCNPLFPIAFRTAL